MKYKGFWENTTSPQSHYGELEIKETGEITLELYTKNKEDEAKFKPYKQFELLYGTTAKNEKITLYRYTSIRGNGNTTFKRVIKYKVCLLGEHRDLSNLVLQKYKVELSNLAGFFALETIGVDVSQPGSNVNKEIHHSEALSIHLISWVKKKISSKSSLYPSRKVSYLEFLRIKEIDLEQCIDEISYLIFLFSILSQIPLRLLEIRIPKLEQRFEGIIEESEMHVYHKNYTSKENQYDIEKGNHAHNINNLNKVINLWLKNKEKWFSVAELYLASMFTKSINPTIRFLNLVTAAESFHRINYQTEDETSKEKYNLLIEQTEDADIKKWIKERKLSFTLLSLPKRLRELSNNDVFKTTSNQKKFVSKCVSYRNYIAHNLIEKSKPVTYIEETALSLILSILITQEFLQKLDMEKANIIRLIKKTETFDRLKRIREINSELEI